MFRIELPYFSREKRPEFGRKRDLYEPLLTFKPVGSLRSSPTLSSSNRTFLSRHFWVSRSCSSSPFREVELDNNNSLASSRPFRIFCSSSGKKKEPKPKLFGPDIFGGRGGGLPREGGGGQKVRYVLRNPGKPNFLAGCPDIFAGLFGGVRKV